MIRSKERRGHLISQNKISLMVAYPVCCNLVWPWECRLGQRDQKVRLRGGDHHIQIHRAHRWSLLAHVRDRMGFLLDMTVAAQCSLLANCPGRHLPRTYYSCRNAFASRVGCHPSNRCSVLTREFGRRLELARRGWGTTGAWQMHHS